MPKTKVSDHEKMLRERAILLYRQMDGQKLRGLNGEHGPITDEIRWGINNTENLTQLFAKLFPTGSSSHKDKQKASDGAVRKSGGG